MHCHGISTDMVEPVAASPTRTPRQSSQKTTTLRRASLGDLDGLLEAYLVSVREIAAKDYTAVQVKAWITRILDPDMVGYLAQQIKQDIVWVVEIARRVEGFAHFRLRADDHPVAYLHALYLAPKAAGSGNGRRLMQRVEEHARALGYRQLGLHSSRTARGFYERLGYFGVGGEILHKVETVGLPCQPMTKDL